MIIYTDSIPFSQNKIYSGSTINMIVILPGQDLKLATAFPTFSMKIVSFVSS